MEYGDFAYIAIMGYGDRATLCLRPIRPWPWGATALGGAKFVENKFFAKRF